MDIKALQLICRFARSPNKKGYCGRGSAQDKFNKCIKFGICDGVEEEIEKFIVLNPYLETISKLIKKPKFSYEVAQAYIFGNDELLKIKNSGYKLLLKNFQKQGVPDWLVADLAKHPPKKFIPTHLFQVLHVGVGRASGSVPYNLETINNCMFRWGQVIKLSKTKITVKLNSLNNKNKLILKTGKFKRNFLISSVKVGDLIAVHWQMPVKILTEDEVSKLDYWTKAVLNSICKP